MVFFKSEALEAAGFVNAFSTRDIYLTSHGDHNENVDENRRRYLSALNAADFTVATAHQTHSSARSIINGFNSQEPNADALLSTEKNLLLAVKTADCLAILIADTLTGVMAAVHAGWRGTQAGIAGKTVKDMEENFGVKVGACLVVMGPSACVDCYQVGEDVAKLFSKEFVVEKAGRRFLDVPSANRDQLVKQGVHPENIFTTGLCTIHQNELFFSHRKEGRQGADKVGRMLGAIGKR